MSNATQSQDVAAPLDMQALAASLPIPAIPALVEDLEPSPRTSALPPQFRRKGAGFLGQTQDELVQERLRNALRAHVELKRKVEDKMAAEDDLMA
uniref:Uncharacterized protein n=1 Tax=Mycena chlorophos TaxID=658473 RepID=A0ABQ0LB44_MYCCL|nr:predicted protein [Mycena chlorophos]